MQSYHLNCKYLIGSSLQCVSKRAAWSSVCSLFRIVNHFISPNLNESCSVVSSANLPRNLWKFTTLIVSLFSANDMGVAEEAPSKYFHIYIWTKVICTDASCLHINTYLNFKFNNEPYENRIHYCLLMRLMQCIPPEAINKRQ